jgi:hypothetical protein
MSFWQRDFFQNPFLGIVAQQNYYSFKFYRKEATQINGHNVEHKKDSLAPAQQA